MDEQSNRPAPHSLIKALKASVQDIVTGRLLDASAVQAEARRMLEEHKAAGSAEVSVRHATPRSRSAD
jgi:hypothetical protein